jgi:hypothetical protein
MRKKMKKSTLKTSENQTFPGSKILIFFSSWPSQTFNKQLTQKKFLSFPFILFEGFEPTRNLNINA